MSSTSASFSGEFYTPQELVLPSSGKAGKTGKTGKASPKISPKSGKVGKASPKMSPKSGKAGKSPKTSPTPVVPECVPFVKAEGKVWRSPAEIREHLVCVQDRRRDNQYYHVRKLQHNNNAYDHFGDEEKMQTCLGAYNRSTGNAVVLSDLADCELAKVASANPDYAYMLQYLQKLNDTGLASDTVLDFLQSLIEYTNIRMASLKEILNGAFTIIRGDGGHFYHTFRQSEDAIECSEWVCGIAETSHDSMTPQYRLGNKSMLGPDVLSDEANAQVSTIFDLLVGQSVLPGDLAGSTWFQFEYARLTGEDMTRALWNRVGEHLIAFVKYKWTGRNQGIFGGSKYAEYNQPLILDLCTHAGKMRSCVSAELRRKKQRDPFEVTEEYWGRYPQGLFTVLVSIKNLVRSQIFQGWRPSTYHTFTIRASLRDILESAGPRKFCSKQVKKGVKTYTIPMFLNEFFTHMMTHCV